MDTIRDVCAMRVPHSEQAKMRGGPTYGARSTPSEGMVGRVGETLDLDMRERGRGQARDGRGGAQDVEEGGGVGG